MGKRKEPSKPDARQTVWGKKGKNLNIRLTEEGYKLAKERAVELGTSVSEVVERWARRYDVNFDDAVPIPPNLDARASVVKSMSGLEIIEALSEKFQEKEASEDFIRKLIKREVNRADVTELAGLLDLEESEVQELVNLIKGGKKPNGV